MAFRRSVRCWFLALAAFVCALGAPVQAREVVLRASYPEQPSIYSLGLAGTGNLSLASVVYPAQLTGSLSYALDTEEVSPEGLATLRLTVNQFKLQITVADTTLTPGEKVPPPLRLQLSPLALLAAPPLLWTEQTDATNSETTQTQAADNSASPGSPPPSTEAGSATEAAGQGAAAETTKPESEMPVEILPQIIFPTAAVLQALVFPPLPEDPVHEESVWKGTQNLPTGSETSLPMTYEATLREFGTVQGVDAAYLHIHFTVPAPGEIKTWASQAVGQWEGDADAVLEVPTGRVITCVTRSRAQVTLTPETGGAGDNEGAGLLAGAGQITLDLSLQSNLALLP